MKIRTDFVTNSSSTSHVAVTIKSTKLMEILKKFKEYLESFGKGTISVSEDHFEFNRHEGSSLYLDLYDWGAPSEKTVISSCFRYHLEKLFIENSAHDDTAKKIISELKANEKEINETITDLYWLVDTGKWGECLEFDDEGDHLKYGDDILPIALEELDLYPFLLRSETYCATYHGGEYEYKEDIEWSGDPEEDE